MRPIIHLFILLIIPSLTHADPKYDDSCLYQFESEYYGETRQRLTVVKNHKIGNLIINFYGTPIWNDMYPHSEGCDSDDGKILIFDKESQKPLYHKSDIGFNYEIFTKDNKIEKYTNIFSQSDEMDFIIKHGYMANCGGCYSVLFFKTDQEFRYLGELFYDPGKYGGTAHYDEYDANKQKIQEYKK
tara:strand:+ start:150 stop:707 length:558 start_codon:yes stop_codon:yes gene_type:complete